ncbi:MAG TPA: hypothetical protein PKM21_18885, partial [Anaerolineales bacterium]|nr:hypothetical protein [Anaerolineales bacterium]
SPQALAKEVKRAHWTCCTAFRLEYRGKAYALLNDTGVGGDAQEFALVELDARRDLFNPGCCGMGWQIESITVSWCSVDELAQIIADAIADPPIHTRVRFRFDPNLPHSCGLCE